MEKDKKLKSSYLDLPVYLYNNGTNYQAHKLFKVCYTKIGDAKLWRFRCYAPGAKSISVVGDFNNWDRNINPMRYMQGGVWECGIARLKKFDIYKFSVEGKNGTIVLKSDPYALHSETSPSNASKLYTVSGYEWKDDDWMDKRKQGHINKPLNIYEVHLGSWKKQPSGEFLSYIDMAKTLVPYVKEMGYTHVELMPITEYPYDGSWGYQVTGLFCPTSRYGTPHDFMYLVDEFHRAGIGVIMDFVLSHFPKDENGLYEFDGTKLYEYEDELKFEHKSWGTRVFDFDKPFIHSFLISAVSFWLSTYHIDGMRLDAVASMLYLDYDRKPDEWKRNKHGDNHNLEAIDFLKKLNKEVLTMYPDVMMIAEESTAFPLVTCPPEVGGLGFNYKWNMGWMNDTLDYVKIDPFFRHGAHEKLTFSLTYAFSENYVLPFSHDEVVHGKSSMIGKMSGGYAEKFKGLKTLFAYQMAHPGKKLNFMGNEFAQFIEWDFKKELDWLLLDFESHKNIKSFVKDLNYFYKTHPPMYQIDNSFEGFKWLVVDDKTQSILIFERLGENKEKVICVFNFLDINREDYLFGVEDEGVYEVVFNSNDTKYGGEEKRIIYYETTEESSHGYPYSISIAIEGHSAIYISKK